MTAVKRIVFIINPVSGTNNKEDIGRKIEEFFKSSSISVTIENTQKAGDANSFALKYSTEKYDAVVAVGGDGTINEVVNGIGMLGVPMGVIPGGSGNGLARHLGIPMKFEKAAQIILEGIYQPIDLVKVNDRLSVNVSGVGFDALVAQRFQNKKKRGLASYIKIVLKEFVNFTAQKYELIVDGKSLVRNAFLISFANSSQFGNNAYISPMASICDGYFDLCIVKPFPKLLAPSLIKDLMMGKLDQSKYLEIFKAKEVILHQDSEIYHMDGDAMSGFKNLEIKILPSVLNMIIPKNKLNKI